MSSDPIDSAAGTAARAVDPVPFVLERDGRPIHGVVHFPRHTEPRPAVVLCHGFKGFMEWGFHPPLAELLASRGFVVVRFDFAGSGMLPGDELVTDPARFRDDTPLRALDELVTVLAALPRLAGDCTDGRIGLVGHSRGGGTALLAAAEPGWSERIGALVTWAAIATFERWGDVERRHWRVAGEVPVVNSRTGQELAMGVGFLEEVESQRERLDLAAAAARRTAPWLIVHGDADTSVPAAEGRRLAATAAQVHQHLEIPGADHTFGARHPFAGPTPELIAAMNATQSWLKRYLG